LVYEVRHLASNVSVITAYQHFKL